MDRCSGTICHCISVNCTLLSGLCPCVHGSRQSDRRGWCGRSGQLFEEFGGIGEDLGVHTVHRVFGGFVLWRGHGLQTGSDLADQGLADAQDSSDLAVGFPLVQQFLDVLVLGLIVLLVGLAEVVVF